MVGMSIGVIGCGNISGIYLKNLIDAGQRVVACADLEPARAAAVGALNSIEAVSVADLFKHPDVSLVLNLTVPGAHSEINKSALQNLKHVYCEKPLATFRHEGQETLDLATRVNRRVGCAPDTFLGGGLQLCRRLIDEGAIGEPVGANAFMMCAGHESWHPSPEFYYEVGGGPLFDMGPYYLTALTTLLGPIRRVSGSARATFPTRTITSQPKSGEVIPVETPTHIVGTLDFERGAIGQMTMSFDVQYHHQPCLEIYGTEGSMSLPDPNGFGGPVLVRRKGDADWREMLVDRGRADNARGIGVIDMMTSIEEGVPHRASGELAFHVLDVMQSILQASDSGESIAISSRVERPALFVD